MNIIPDQFSIPSFKSLAFFAVIGLAIQANLASAAFVTGIPQEENPSFIGEEVEVVVTLDDTAAGLGNILVCVDVIPGPNNIIGDIRAIYFHIADESLLVPASSFELSPVDGNTPFDVTNALYDANSVNNFAASNGDNINPHGIFDMGFEIGTEGITNDDIQLTKFVLSNTDVPLNVSLFELQEFGVRLANVGPAGGARSNSIQRDAKQIGTFPRAVPEPTTWLACSLFAVFGIGRTTLRRTRK